MLKIFLLLAAVVAVVNSSCLDIKRARPSSPSGIYTIFLPSGTYSVYCEMAINGGGYTFISNAMLSSLTSADMSHLDSQSGDVLLRILKPDSTQPYTVISQAGNGLSIQLNGHEGYPRPVNHHLGVYLYLATSLIFKSNGKDIKFVDCDGNPNRYFAFFSNPEEKAVSRYHDSNLRYEKTGVAIDWRKTAKRPSSPGRQLPAEFFFLTELHYGGCGTYTSSDRWLASAQPALGTAIGLR